jgi:5-methylcytosine-specific restriction endonuclease McrA
MCVYCGARYEHIDHIVALASGGLHCVENLTTACASCNLNKWSKSLENWLTDTIDIKTLTCELGVKNG